MAKAKQRTKEVDEVRAYLEGVAKYLTDKLYGPKGPAWGTKLTQIEDMLLDVREVLTGKMLDLALARQAESHSERPADHQHCPRCGQEVACTEEEPRVMQTKVGEAEWSEPEGRCGCRRSFFPSVAESGD